VKVKDIIKEGFMSSFAKGFLPKGVQSALAGGRPKPIKPGQESDPAKLSYQMFGMNPEFNVEDFKARISHLSEPAQQELLKRTGEISWYDPYKLSYLTSIGKDNAEQSKQQLKKDASSKDALLKMKPTSMSAQSAQAMAKDIFGAGLKRPSSKPTTPPSQVKLPSGEYITKYGDSWYNEQGQKIIDPGSISSLERRSQKPSGQAQMATTKNIPVTLPGYKGKRK